MPSASVTVPIETPMSHSNADVDGANRVMGLSRATKAARALSRSSWTMRHRRPLTHRSESRRRRSKHGSRGPPPASRSRAHSWRRAGSSPASFESHAARLWPAAPVVPCCSEHRPETPSLDAVSRPKHHRERVSPDACARQIYPSKPCRACSRRAFLRRCARHSRTADCRSGDMPRAPATDRVSGRTRREVTSASDHPSRFCRSRVRSSTLSRCGMAPGPDGGPVWGLACPLSSRTVRVALLGPCR